MLRNFSWSCQKKKFYYLLKRKEINKSRNIFNLLKFFMFLSYTNSIFEIYLHSQIVQHELHSLYSRIMCKFIKKFNY